MKAFYLISGILLILLGLILIIINPLFGILVIIFGIYVLYIRTKLIKNDAGKWVFESKKQQSAEPVQDKHLSSLSTTRDDLKDPPTSPAIEVPSIDTSDDVEKEKKYNYSNEEVRQYVQSLTGFPEVDEHGMKILRTLDDVPLTGVTKEYEGVNPQDTIEMLSEGEEVFFKRVPMKKYPNAILVVDCNDNPIGWIPEDFAYQEDIAKRLDDGTTVKGRVSAILGGYNGKSYGVRIDIARYTKKSATKK